MSNFWKRLFPLVAIFAAAGCAPERAPAPEAQPANLTAAANAVTARFDNQGILIIPFDRENEARRTWLKSSEEEFYLSVSTLLGGS